MLLANQETAYILMTDGQDTEISLGTGKLLGLFFGLVVLCAGFFGVGYMIGKNSGTPLAASTDATATTETNGAPKPSPASGAAPQPKAQDCTTSGNCDQQQSNGSDLTFYKTVEEKNLNSQLVTPPASPAPSSRQAEQRSSAPAPEIAKGGSAANGSYVVQVAAVSKQQDADALVAALRKKQYPVFVISNPPNDKLFHVQAGPFADFKEAESVRTRLINDGYSPILKR